MAWSGVEWGDWTVERSGVEGAEWRDVRGSSGRAWGFGSEELLGGPRNLSQGASRELFRRTPGGAAKCVSARKPAPCNLSRNSARNSIRDMAAIVFQCWKSTPVFSAESRLRAWPLLHNNKDTQSSQHAW